ncbi:hypothetical protein KR018_009036 [Drosophila ironensis]|nr:hypothetical protein KR018_009036 [Drosophila ironensis]
MLENISFLFLSALAFVAWVLLCYLHEIELQRRRSSSDYDVQLYTEHPGITFLSPQDTNDSELQSSAYDFAKNFGVVFAVTFGLSKLLQLAERHAKSYLKTREQLLGSIRKYIAKPIHFTDKEETQLALSPLDVPVKTDDNVELKEQLQVLQAHCHEMRELLQELRASSSFCSQKSGNVSIGEESNAPERQESDMLVWRRTDSMTETPPSGSSQPLLEDPERPPASRRPSQNIYITNSQIHIDGGVFWTANSPHPDLSRVASRFNRRRSEFLQVWDRFIKAPKERPMLTHIQRHNILL